MVISGHGYHRIRRQSGADEVMALDRRLPLLPAEAAITPDLVPILHKGQEPGALAVDALGVWWHLETFFRVNAQVDKIGITEPKR